MSDRYPKLSEKIYSERNYLRCKDDWVAHAVELEQSLDALRAERDEAREMLKQGWEQGRPLKPHTQWPLPTLDVNELVAMANREAERRGFEACREAARQRFAEEARAFLVEFGPSDAARIAMDCMRHAEDVVAKLQPPTDVTVTVREQKGKR